MQNVLSRQVTYSTFFLASDQSPCRSWQLDHRVGCFSLRWGFKDEETGVVPQIEAENIASRNRPERRKQALLGLRVYRP